MPKWIPVMPPWRHAYRAAHRDFVAECEAFCLGHFAEHALETSREVPVWAWTNLLAHGTDEELRCEVAQCANRRSSARDWRGARAYLVTEILETVGRGAALDELQRQVLQPLELQLCGQKSVDWWTPRRWVTTVRASLCAYEHSRRR